MNVDVALLPEQLRPEHLRQTVVVFDVLRATTSMIAALAAGVREIRIFGSAAEAQAAASDFTDPKLLCGEQNCIAPPGFDLGNSPRAFGREAHGGRTMFMATTNGTRAIIAARAAPAVLMGAIVNASAAANRAASLKRDVTLLCAGTNGAVAMEDVLGAGAVLDALIGGDAQTKCASDLARIALSLFRAERNRLPETLRTTAGGRNVIAANLEPDIDFAARLNAYDLVPIVRDLPLRVMLPSN